MSFVVIIPARYAASRLPGKPLLDINGKPMIVHVLDRARESGAQRVIVATDHEQVAQAVSAAGGEVCMTRADHQSGTERLAEVVERYQFADETCIINVQGDEPMIPPLIIRQLAENLRQCRAGMATLATPLMHRADIFNPNVVKVALDSQGYALYFSRAPIPWHRQQFASLTGADGDNCRADNSNTDNRNTDNGNTDNGNTSNIGNRHSGNGNTENSHSAGMANHPVAGDITGDYLRHLGIYGYRAGFIRRYVTWLPCALEKIEMLEQLRVLWHGEKIHVAVAQAVPGTGVDTPEDLQHVRRAMSA